MSEDSNGRSSSGTKQQAASSCIACKHQRRKCRDECLLKPYFGSNNARDFLAAQKVFGISNMNKILKEIRVQDRPKAIQSLVWEASIWKQDLVNGPLAHFTRLQQENALLKNQINQLNFHIQNMRENPNYSTRLLGFQELNNHGVGVLPNYHNSNNNNNNVVAAANRVNAVPGGTTGGGSRPPPPRNLQGQDRNFGYNNIPGAGSSVNFNNSRQGFDNYAALALGRASGIRGFQNLINDNFQHQFGGDHEEIDNQRNLIHGSFQNIQQQSSNSSSAQQLQNYKYMEGNINKH